MKKEYHFINKAGTWQIDLLVYSGSSYITINSLAGYVFVAYNPATKLIFLKFIENKTPDDCLDCFRNFQQFLKTSNAQVKDVKEIISDSGNEYKGSFEQYIQQEKIKHKIINPDISDHLALAPINSIMRYIRNQMIKRMIQIQKANEHFLGSDELQSIVQDIQLCQNNFKKIPKYHKTPIQVTIDDITDVNNTNEILNNDIDQKYKYNIGDIVRIKLQKEQFDKSRHQLYSDGKYKIIGKLGQQYIIIPIHFDKKEYNDYFKPCFDFKTLGIPCYFRKSYEMKISKEESDDSYFVAENQFSKMFTFKQILNCSEKDFNKIDGNTKYIIELDTPGGNGKQYELKAYQLRNDINIPSEVEKKYFFPRLYKNINIDTPIFKYSN